MSRDRGIWSLPGLAELHRDADGGEGVAIAILDGPCDLGHPALRGASLETVVTLAGEGTGEGGTSAHGTHVCSVLFGNPEGDVPGLVPRGRGVLLPIYRPDPEGRLVACKQRDLARALEKAMELGAHVVNVSGGELSDSGRADYFLERAVRNCSENGLLVVAASGNDGCECTQVPAGLPDVLAVGAMDEQGRPLDFSNWGESVRRNGILAPGRDVLGAAPSEGVAARSGTSFATPVVSGVAALLTGLQRLRGGEADPLEVRKALLESAIPCDPRRDGDCRRLLAGRINIPGARKLLGLDSPAPSAGVSSHTVSESGSPDLPRKSEADLSTTQTETAKERDMSEKSNQSESPEVRPAEAEAAESGAAAPESAGVEAACACKGQDGPAESSKERASEAGADESAQGTRPSAPDPSSSPQDPPPAAPAVRSSGQPEPVRAPGVRASDCEGLTDLVFAIGEIGYDFGCEARLDYFVQQLGSMSAAFNPVDMANYLAGRKKVEEITSEMGVDESALPPEARKKMDPLPAHEEDANALIWTLNIDATPVYAIDPVDQFALVSYSLLIRFLFEQYVTHREPPESLLAAGGGKKPSQGKKPSEEDKESGGGGVLGTKANENYRVALAGRLRGTKRLYNGTVVPTIEPVSRGMYSWSLIKLAKAALGPKPGEKEVHALVNFLQQVYYALRNLGQTPQDRALNYSATNAYNAGQVFKQAFKEGLVLDRFSVVKSPICRPESDCWDVRMLFFDPKEIFQKARSEYLYTIDVSDVVPVTVGPLRSFQVYSDPVK